MILKVRSIANLGISFALLFQPTFSISEKVQPESKSYLATFKNKKNISDTIKSIQSTLNLVNPSKFPLDTGISEKYKVLLNSSISTVLSLNLSQADFKIISKIQGILSIEEDKQVVVHDFKPTNLYDFSDSLTEIGPEALNNEKIIPFFDILSNEVSYPFSDDYSNWITQKYSPWQLGRVSSKTSIPFNYSPYGQEYYYPQSKSDVIVYVVDSGIDSSHLELAGKVRLGSNFVPSEDNVDYAGHGTAVAAVISGVNNGVAKNAKIVSVKVLDKKNTGTTSTVFQGLTWVLNDKKANYPDTPAIVNLSINFEAPSNILNAALKSLSDIGILTVSSSGNTATNQCEFFPGNSDYSLIVSSILPGSDSFDSIFSNFGPCVDILAPGNRVFSAVAGSVNEVRPYIGTSFAAGIVTGVGALVLSNSPNLTSNELFDTIIENGIENAISNVPSDTKNLMIFNGYSGIKSKISYFN
ncbi:Subtilase-type proteinase psp3 [Smittium culicis]|uniref:Subtilase-type proteinase psp3 n=1 Tax=Smittium culicis TaxID=133412 RepID=A0A1R1XYV2_9FUNG|nr:Subtilase-type proteinase psp3 [Smittium culicis]